MAISARPPAYRTETHTVVKRERRITVENQIPELPEQERTKQAQAIENGLFDIFMKYRENEKREMP